MRCNVDVKYLGRAVAEEDLATALASQTDVSERPVKRPCLRKQSLQCKRVVRLLWHLLLRCEHAVRALEFYVGEYATKKSEPVKQVLPEMFKGLQRLEADLRKKQDLASKQAQMDEQEYRAYRCLARVLTSYNRCVSKSPCEMAKQLLFQSGSVSTHSAYTCFMRFALWAVRTMRMRDCECMGPALGTEGGEEHVPLDTILEEYSSLGGGDEETVPPDQTAQDAAGEALVADDAATVEARPAAKRQRKTSSQFVTTSQKDDYMHRGAEGAFATNGPAHVF